MLRNILKPVRIVANLVGMMLFVQVILGGSATVLGFPVISPDLWSPVFRRTHSRNCSSCERIWFQVNPV